MKDSANRMNPAESFSADRMNPAERSDAAQKWPSVKAQRTSAATRVARVCAALEVVHEDVRRRIPSHTTPSRGSSPWVLVARKCLC